MAGPGPVLCVAPAGSGKTTTVVARLAWRVAGGVAPSAICALTFNRRAAEELRERADSALAMLGVEAGSIRVSTFHALGRAILSDAGVDVDRIVDRGEVLDELAGADLPGAARRWLDDAFTRLKLDPERGPPPEDVETYRLFEAYQARLAERREIDLDDLVARAAPALRGDADLLARWRARAAVLFVDEAQDLDRAQLDLALLLAGEALDIFLVGDDDQTIYAWRLADVRRVLGLAARLPGLRRVDLETNHRCAPQIVQRASRLVAHNVERFDKRIRASPSAVGSVTIVADIGDEVARARWLLTAWARGVLEGAGERWAVLARTNRELVPYAALSLELGLPFRIEDDGLVLDEPGVLETIDLAMAGPAGMAPLRALQAAAQATGLRTELAAALLGWAAPYRDLAVLRDELVDRVARLRRHREAMEGRTERDGIVSEIADHATPLTLATVHGTKGLEWDHVACIGLDEGTFPSGRSLREPADPDRALEEERRLAYVAWTRARRTLTLVCDPGAPSRFIAEAFDPHELPWGRGRARDPPPHRRSHRRQRGTSPRRAAQRSLRRSIEKSTMARSWARVADQMAMARAYSSRMASSSVS
jgi:DNA helicase-2/ATP-dependent DNA helicase PcrA